MAFESFSKCRALSVHLLYISGSRTSLGIPNWNYDSLYIVSAMAKDLAMVLEASVIACDTILVAN